MLKTPASSLRFLRFLRFRRCRPVGAGLAVLLALAAGACGAAEADDPLGAGRRTIRLGEVGLTPMIDDIQSDAPEGSEVDVVFTTFSGDERNFVAYAGSPLVINFFARSCPPCLSEMRYLQQASEVFTGTVDIVGISVDPLRADAEALIAETGVTYDLGWDPHSEVFEHFGAMVMPTTVFVSSDATVQEMWSGALTREALFDRIEVLR